MRKLITCPAMSRSNSSPDTGVPMVGLVIGAHAASIVSNSAIQRTRPHPCCRFPSRILGPNAAARKSALRALLRRLSQEAPDTVGEVGSGGEGGEARGAGGGTRDRPEPGGQALEIDCSGGGDVLQVGFG